MPAHKTGKVIKCPGCGVEHYRKGSELKQGTRFCSYRCWRENGEPVRFSDESKDRTAEAKRGPKNPNFKHGQRAGDARRSKFSLKLKGESYCRACGSAQQLHLHHMVPRSKAVKGRDEILNGMPLCNSCHMSWHRRGRVVIHRDLMTEAEWECVQTLASPSWLDERYPDRGLPFRDPDREPVFD